MRRAYLVIILLFLPYGSAVSATREVITELASLIETNYFDAEKGKQIARELRSAERQGAFATYSDSRDLAAALTLRLKASDRHFNVQWYSAPTATIAAGASDGVALRTLSGRTSGFRAVQLLSGGVGYIDIRNLPYISFRRSDDPARSAADSALQLVSGAAAIILDLRFAVGGYPEMAGYLVSAFVAPDANLYNEFQGRDEVHSERPARGYPNPRVDIPLYVLISGSTASAAESTAYTLQAAKRAVLVGERTSGAANPGGTLPVREGFNVFISTSTPINPITGTNWEGAGVQPDVETPSERALEHAHVLALQKLLDSSADSAPTDARWALEYLTATSSPILFPLSEYVGRYGDATISLTANALHVRRHRHPPMRLRHFRDDTFIVEGDANIRVTFEREGSRLRGFQLVRASGFSIWHPRDRD